MIQTSSIVISNEEVTPGKFLMYLESPLITKQAQPGQFVMVSCGEDTVLRRPISVHNVDGDKLALFYMVVGKGTEWLAHKNKGDSLDILGPLGNGFNCSGSKKRYLLVAGGIGIAPLRFLMDKAQHPDCQITLLQGAAAKQSLYPAELMPRDVRFVTATEDGSSGYKGFITDLLPDYTANADEVFICGPMPMLRHISENRKTLIPSGIPAYISLEMRMACGLGICYGCTIRTDKGLKQVCKDGPVFDLNEVVWDELTRL